MMILIGIRIGSIEVFRDRQAGEGSHADLCDGTGFLIARFFDVWVVIL